MYPGWLGSPLASPNCRLVLTVHSAGRAAAGSMRLPSEIELAQHYGAAQMTVRRAVRGLKERGIGTVGSGKGTYVLPRD